MNLALIGAANSHTLTFCRAINGERKYEGYKITHVYGGDDPAACAKLSAEHGLIVCVSEDEAIAACGAAIITYRRGTLHHGAAMKALRAGKAIFNDKPFATSAEQAREIAEYAESNGLLVCGGSDLKDLDGIDAVKDRITAGSTAVISFAADPDSVYDGLWFYGIHAAELCVKLLGRDFEGVGAFRTGGGVISSVNYGDRRAVIVNTPDAAGLNISIMSGGGAETINVPTDYASIGPDRLIGMLETGKPPYDYSFYVAATDLMEKIVGAIS